MIHVKIGCIPLYSLSAFAVMLSLDPCFYKNVASLSQLLHVIDVAMCFTVGVVGVH